jgi:hypothetical protein
MDRISTATDPTRIGDETDPWDAFLAGDLDFADLDAENQALARRHGLA